jgi:hypothetical protein
MQEDEQDKVTGRAVADALKLVKDLLYTLGADGDEAIQRLLAAEGALRTHGRETAETETFRAFHAGFSAQEERGATGQPPPWAGEGSLRAAYETGALAASLNARCRAGNFSRGWNVGPFDHPDVRLAFARADAACGQR